MNVAVTGALGHIGSRLVRDLPKIYPDCKLLLIDNFATQRYCSLFDLPVSGQIRLVEADILNADLPALLETQDVVVHLAAITDATSSFDRKEEVEEVNFVGAKNVADACLETGSAFIFPSTTSVYGPQGEVVSEDCPKSDLNPQSPYADAKLRAEGYTGELVGKGLSATIFRFGTIFGISPGMRFHTAINKFCWQAATGQPITVWRTALDQKRPYLDLGDAVRAIAFAIEKRLFDGEVFNVVTINETVRGLIEEISAIVPSVSISYVDTAIMNQLSYTVSTDLLKNRGYVYRGCLSEGIRSTLARLEGIRDTKESVDVGERARLMK